MAVITTEYKHIQLDGAGNAVVADSSMKVIELVTSHLAYGWSPEELHFQYPHLSLGQIFSALAYYWDHKEALDVDMQQRLERAVAIRQASPSPIADKLRAQGLIS